MLGTALVSLNTAGSITPAIAATATTSALATIVGAISLVATTNLHFGRVVPHPTTAGTAVVDPAGANTYTGGVADGGSVGVVQAAGFTIDGDQGVDIQVTAAPVALTGPGPSMALSAIKYSLGPTTATDTTTFQIPTTATAPLALTVGGTIAVANAPTQTVGAYTGSIVLTANYN